MGVLKCGVDTISIERRALPVANCVTLHTLLKLCASKVFFPMDMTIAPTSLRGFRDVMHVKCLAHTRYFRNVADGYS